MQWRQEDMVYLKHFICIIISIHRSIVNERIQQKGFEHVLLNGTRVVKAEALSLDREFNSCCHHVDTANPCI